jgi:cytoskeleton protein RodZ
MNAGDHDGQEEEQQRTRIGAVLESRRLEKGLSLREVEQATKIRTRYLEGLEQEDYSVLPDAVYVQGFLKTYANFLGLDGERLSRELRDRRAPRRERQPVDHEGYGAGDFERPLTSLGGLGGAERRRISGATLLTVALAVLVLAAVVGGLYLIGARSAEEAQKEEEAPAEPESSPSSEETAGSPAGGGEDTSALAGTVRATVRAVGGSSGLTISTDGTVAYAQVAQSGFSQAFEARDVLHIEAANGGNVEVELNGRNLGRIGTSGQPVTRDFTPQSPEVTGPEATGPEATTRATS